MIAFSQKHSQEFCFSKRSRSSSIIYFYGNCPSRTTNLELSVFIYVVCKQVKISLDREINSQCQSKQQQCKSPASVIVWIVDQVSSLTGKSGPTCVSMMNKLNEFSVILERDGQSTPWGIRLVGGSDLDTPLIITKVVSITSTTHLSSYP